MRDLIRSATALLLATACFGAFSQETQPHPRIAIRWGVVSNFLPAGGTSCELTLTNRGTVPLSSAGWTLFFNFSRDIIPQSLPASVHLTHINGDFYKLEPTTTFQPVKPGGDVKILFSAQAPVINASAGPDGFYFVFADSKGNRFAPELPASVTAQPLLSAEQINRGPKDRLPAQTPAQRFLENQALTKLPADAVGEVIPTPVHLKLRSGRSSVDARTEIHYTDGLESEASYLAEALRPLVGSRVQVIKSVAHSPRTIALSFGRVTVDSQPKKAGDTAYFLSINTHEGISIVGTDGAGVFYGIQTLRETHCAWRLRSEAKRDFIARDRCPGCTSIRLSWPAPRRSP